MAPGSHWHEAGSTGGRSGRMAPGSHWHEAGSTGGRSGRMTSGSHWHEAGSTGGGSVRLIPEFRWNESWTERWRSPASVWFHCDSDAFHAAALVEHEWQIRESCVAKPN